MFLEEEEIKKNTCPEFNFNDLESMSDGFWQTPEVEIKRRNGGQSDYQLYRSHSNLATITFVCLVLICC